MATWPMTPALAMRHVTKRFAGTTALADVSIELKSGEIHAVCGENGAGKSTLIKVLSGVHPYRSYEGKVEVAGAEARWRSIRDASRAGIAVIHQELALVDTLCIAENVFLGQEPTRCGFWVDRGSARRRTAALLARFNVPLDAAAPLRTLSVGQKQLVEIAKALARDSRILILDEPTAALAAHETAALLGILRDLKNRGVSCIYVSHRLDEVFAIADRVTVLRDGAVVCTQAAAETDAATVVRQMVGRDITPAYVRRPGAPGATLLAVQGLTVAARRPATRGRTGRLHDISFEVRAGEVVGIGGLMGAGRSELLMHLYGAWGTRIAGRVELAGRALAGSAPRAALRARMAMVGEDRRRQGLLLDESVGVNLSLASLPAFARLGVVRGRAEEAANCHWFDTMGIRAAGLGAAVRRLSGGNQQKVLLGRALMTAPRVVMLDEPTRGIDVGAKLAIHALIDRFASDGCAVLIVSSDLPELIALSDRILMLCAGTIGGSFTRGNVTPERLMQAALGSVPAGPSA